MNPKFFGAYLTFLSAGIACGLVSLKFGTLVGHGEIAFAATVFIFLILNVSHDHLKNKRSKRRLEQHLKNSENTAPETPESETVLKEKRQPQENQLPKMIFGDYPVIAKGEKTYILFEDLSKDSEQKTHDMMKLHQTVYTLEEKGFSVKILEMPRHSELLRSTLFISNNAFHTLRSPQNLMGLN